MSLRGTGQGGTFSRALEVLEVLGSAGFLHPGRMLALGAATKKWGPTPAAGFAASASRRPDAVAIIDDDGQVTYAELDRRTNAIANGLAAAGVRAGHGVGLFARNHIGFVEATIALGKLGADTLLLNTGFAAPQLSEVLEREGVDVVVYDEEFAKVVDAGGGGRHRVVSYGSNDGHPTLDDLVKNNSDAEPVPPSRHGRTTILTSGTTGTPKGAQRSARSAGLDSLVGIMGRMPLVAEQINFVVAPTFHSWGGAHLLMASLASCTVVLRRRFDPEDTLATIDREQPYAMAVVPVMMQRILQLPPEVIRKYDCSSVRVVGASGSALPGELAVRWMDTFGDNLHNFYGSTEVATASIAMPDELRAVPGTAGRPPRGVVVRIIDENGKKVPTGTVGRIFVGNDAQFEGYTGGGNKEVVDGLMSSGDVGHFDENGLLFVDGRDDDMIISGGENVFPREVEDLLADHPAIEEASVIGVPDDEFGQRLKGFVVVKSGESVTEADLKAHVKTHLARYKIPREIVFLDALPRNPTGKVLKRVLAES
ncbi:MAG: acyl-CoA synthetase (AMP-forming)/AMP-acid ligase II [Hyphomicrobiaceae bacterium]|jgi:acyl-CoA synthetase (AMP-forming)/AMP-acid ligase II